MEIVTTVKLYHNFAEKEPRGLENGSFETSVCDPPPVNGPLNWSKNMVDMNRFNH